MRRLMWKAAAPQYGRPLLRDLIEADDVLNGFDCSSSQAARPTDETAFDSDIVASMPGTVLLRESLFYPGGGGQLADRGRQITDQGEYAVTGIEMRGDNAWHRIDRDVELHGKVRAEVDAAFRHLMCQLHTDLHVVNVLVYRAFAHSSRACRWATTRRPASTSIYRTRTTTASARSSRRSTTSSARTSADVRRHPSAVHRALASRPDPEDREQGPPQPASGPRGSVSGSVPGCG